ncbi:MAG: hypothetical protein ABFD07_12745, partial [Methanobacterium sp.]
MVTDIAIVFKIPIVNFLLGITVMSLLPGYLILSILNIHFKEQIHKIVFSVGMSLFIWMGSCLLLDMISKFFNVSHPLTLTKIIIMSNTILFILIIL